MHEVSARHMARRLCTIFDPSTTLTHNKKDRLDSTVFQFCLALLCFLLSSQKLNVVIQSDEIIFDANRYRVCSGELEANSP